MRSHYWCQCRPRELHTYIHRWIMFKKGVRSLSLFYIRLNCGIYTSSPCLSFSLSRCLLPFIRSRSTLVIFFKTISPFQVFFLSPFGEIWRISLHLHIQKHFTTSKPNLYIYLQTFLSERLFFTILTQYTPNSPWRESHWRKEKKEPCLPIRNLWLSSPTAVVSIPPAFSSGYKKKGRCIHNCVQKGLILLSLR